MRHSGPAAFEPAHFFVSFLCASKEMKNNFYYAFHKSKTLRAKKQTITFALLFSKAKNIFTDKLS